MSEWVTEKRPDGSIVQRNVGAIRSAELEAAKRSSAQSIFASTGINPAETGWIWNNYLKSWVNPKQTIQNQGIANQDEMLRQRNQERMGGFQEKINAMEKRGEASLRSGPRWMQEGFQRLMQ